jgi:hypothetical protein
MSKNFITGNGKFSTEAEAIRDVYENEIYKFTDNNNRKPVCVKYMCNFKIHFCMQFWSDTEIKNKRFNDSRTTFVYCGKPNNLCYDGDYIIGDRKQTGAVGSAAAWGIEVGTIDGTSKISSMVYAEYETNIMEYVQDAFKKGAKKVSKEIFEIL